MLFQEVTQEKQLNQWEFIELWIDPIVFPPTILMLIKNNNNQFDICDIAQNNKIIFSSKTYDEANLWLLEDEYERVDGRLLAEEFI